MTNKQTMDKRGGILLIALIFTIVLSTLIASAFTLVNSEHRSAIRTLNRETAFHIAESGIEIAMCALKNGAVANSSDWSDDGYGNYLYSQSNINLNGATGKLDILLELMDASTGECLVSCLGTVDNGGLSVQRAVQSTMFIVAESAPATSGGGDYPYGVATEGSQNYGHVGGSGRSTLGSYDTDVSPDPAVSGGSENSLVSLMASGNAIWIADAELRGSMLTSGGTASGQTNQPNEYDNAYVKGEESTNESGIDPNMVSNSFDGEINSPEPPTAAVAHNVVSIHQNDNGIWNGQTDKVSAYDFIEVTDGGLVLGQTGLCTYISTSSMSPNMDLNIRGDVILVVDNTINMNKDLYIPDDASLSLIVNNGTISLCGDVTNNYPANLCVYGTSEWGQSVVLHSDLFVGVLNVPYSNLQFDGQCKEFRGAIVAKSFSSTNIFNIFYDVALGRGAGGEGGEASAGDENIVNIDSWNEVPPASILSKFSS